MAITDYDNAVKAEHKTGGRACECTECGAWFGGVGGFDRHLVGTSDKPKCLTAERMQALGMTQNVHGVWLMGTSTGKGVGRKRKVAA